MTPREFAFLSDLVRRRSGIVLTPEKKALAKGRLKPVAQRFGFRDTSALLAELPYPHEELARAIAGAMTTNETSFFRNHPVFDSLARSVIPALVCRSCATRRLRIWCAAASTGQEAYSLAMILDAAGLAALGWRIDLIATDISEEAIDRARQGRYSSYEVSRGLPRDRLERYFANDEGQWRVIDRLRHMVSFRTFNLLDHFGWLGELDIVLCRNVLFYLGGRERTEILAELSEAIADDGRLVLGENEDVAEHFVAEGATSGLFVKRPAAQIGLRRRAG